jgi:Asp/Glu/hydantoin racemase
MSERILVINANATEAVTRAMHEACEVLHMTGGPAIDCVTLMEGPPGIEPRQHVDSVIAPTQGIVGSDWHRRG